MNRCPNFLYIGTSKAGSTWLYSVLASHPDIYMAPGKGLYFFDSNYDRGPEWYRRHFAGAGTEPIVGEVSHSYMYCHAASSRIADLNENMRLMVCLREPASRAFSAFLDGLKNGQFQGSFEDMLDEIPSLLERGRYTKYLAPFVDRFGRNRIHVGVFDELASRPDEFVDELYRFLGLDRRRLESCQRKRMMPAGRPRSQLFVTLVKQASYGAKSLGLRKLRGRLKTSRTLRNALYRPYESNERPRMAAATTDRLKRHFQQEVRELDALLGTNLQDRWGYK